MLEVSLSFGFPTGSASGEGTGTSPEHPGGWEMPSVSRYDDLGDLQSNLSPLTIFDNGPQ